MAVLLAQTHVAPTGAMCELKPTASSDGTPPLVLLLAAALRSPHRDLEVAMRELRAGVPRSVAVCPHRHEDGSNLEARERLAGELSDVAVGEAGVVQLVRNPLKREVFNCNEASLVMEREDNVALGESANTITERGWAADTLIKLGKPVPTRPHRLRRHLCSAEIHKLELTQSSAWDSPDLKTRILPGAGGLRDAELVAQSDAVRPPLPKHFVGLELAHELLQPPAPPRTPQLPRERPAPPRSQN